MTIQSKIILASLPAIAVIGLGVLELALAQQVDHPTTIRIWGKLSVVDESQERPATGARIRLVPEGQSIVLDGSAVVDGESRWQLFSSPVMDLAEEFTVELQATHRYLPGYVIVKEEAERLIRPERLLDDGQAGKSIGEVYLRSPANAAAYVQNACDRFKRNDENCYQRALNHAQSFDLFQRVADIQQDAGKFGECAATFSNALDWIIKTEKSGKASTNLERRTLESRRDEAGRTYITCLLNFAEKEQSSDNADRAGEQKNFERERGLWQVANEAERVLRLGVEPDDNRHRGNIFSAWLRALHLLASEGPAWDADLARSVVNDENFRESFDALYFDFLTDCAREYIDDVDKLVEMIQGVKRTMRGNGRRACERKSS